MSIQVVETPQVTALRTLILKQLDGDSTQQREVVQASFRAIFALQDALTLNKEWIWSVPSVLHARNDAYVLYEPPLAVHFRLIDLGKNRHYRSRISSLSINKRHDRRVQKLNALADLPFWRVPVVHHA